MLFRKRIVVYFVLAALVTPAIAAASSHSGTGGCGSACDQYNEHYPTSSGSKVVGSGKTTVVKLPKATEMALKSQKSLKSTNSGTRRKISELVTSSRFGAPTSTIPTVKNPDPSLVRSLGAAFVSPASGSLARLAILLAAIIGTTVAVAVTAVRKQRVVH